jgi:hypothetical protein
MGSDAGKMFCCAMIILPACCWMAATTRGWQCPVDNVPMPHAMSRCRRPSVVQT